MSDALKQLNLPQNEIDLLLDLERRISKKIKHKRYVFHWGVGFQAINGHVTKLGLIKVKLSEIPDSINEFKELKSLILFQNGLTELPDSITELKNLEELRIPLNQISSLPENLGNLENLNKFDGGGNQLSTLPDSICNLHNLEVLDLTGNQLLQLPENFGQLKKLTKLEIYANKLDKLPSSFNDLNTLNYLDMSTNLLETLPDLSGLENLEVLVLDSNKLESIPLWVYNLPKLKKLDISYNELEELGRDVFKLIKLDYLNLRWNRKLGKTIAREIEDNSSTLNSKITNHILKNLIEKEEQKVLSKCIEELENIFDLHLDPSTGKGVKELDLQEFASKNEIDYNYVKVIADSLIVKKDGNCVRKDSLLTIKLN